MTMDAMMIDCDTCPVRQVRCDDCMVGALTFDTIPVRGETHRLAPLDPAELRAVAVLVQAGLVSTSVAGQARARVEVWEAGRDELRRALG